MPLFFNALPHNDTNSRRHSVADRHDHPWSVVYSFVNDRIQAIRQDATYQVSSYKQLLMVQPLPLHLPKDLDDFTKHQ